MFYSNLYLYNFCTQPKYMLNINIYISEIPNTVLLIFIMYVDRKIFAKRIQNKRKKKQQNS